MAALTQKEITDAANRIRTGLTADLQRDITRAVTTAQAVAPGLDTMMILAATTRIFATFHSHLASMLDTPMERTPDQIMAAAIVLARYLGNGLVPQSDMFDPLAEWKTALTDVERLKVKPS